MTDPDDPNNPITLKQIPMLIVNIIGYILLLPLAPIAIAIAQTRQNKWFWKEW